ncbi:hypothetical protein AAD001_00060 [Colwelliaceae bacterium 6471]
MSAEQLRMLQKLSQLFEEGRAGPHQVQQLSELLAIINSQMDHLDPSKPNNMTDPTKVIKI